jgi:hypothetical protein
MRGQEMAKFVLNSFDKLITYLTISVFIGGGFFIHIITALTIKSYYGSTWGYISFMLPGFAELYLTIIQISEQMYNYMIIVASFLTLTAAVGLTWLFKNSVRLKLERIKEH